MGIFWFNFSRTPPAGQIKICAGLKLDSSNTLRLVLYYYHAQQSMLITVHMGMYTIGI